MSHASSSTAGSFRDLLLRYRGRCGLTQRQLAERLSIHRRSIQEWENGTSYPSTERLEGLIRALLQAHGLTPDVEAVEAEALWSAVEHAAPHTHPPFDATWFARLLTEHAPPGVPSARTPAPPVERTLERGTADRRYDWGEAPDTSGFVGRAKELDTLSGWVVDERCRLVAVLGLGGIGKTSLAAKLAHDVAPGCERVYWRSLRDAPPVSEWLAGAIGFLSDQQLVPPATESERIMALLQLLRDRRCLLVLDNFETLFEPGHAEGLYGGGLAGYGRLLEAAGGAGHRSCLVLTSRQAPPELAVLEAEAVRTLRLGGLSVDDAQGLLAPKQLRGTSEQWTELIAHFGGNGLALKVVSESVRDLFGGEIGDFLDEARGGTMFSGIRRLLSEQVEQSSAPEQQVLRMLAVEREPVGLSELTILAPRIGRGAVLEALEALRRRSLIERAETPGAAAFTLQSVVLEYVTDRLVEVVADEIERAQPAVLIEQPLIKAQAKEYVRLTQERLLGMPILQRLTGDSNAARVSQGLLALLDAWRGRPPEQQGYGPGNVVNLLRLLRGDLRGVDLSRLTIRQAYMAGVEAQDASLAGGRLADVVLGDAFSSPLSLALSADGAFLAVGTAAGEVWVWQVSDRKLLFALRGHTGAVMGVALSQDGRLLAS
ncbi:MAG: helix-turn-helix domain-containing protein, partial [Chloroflexi bacterium]|nr:helix-turn-helix domain-containing protein [Chloroflexota bacterium]